MTGPTFTGSKGDPLARIEHLRKAGVPHDVDAEEAGQYQRSMIELRTSRGVDVNNQKFVPYSERYGKDKQFSVGRGATVDLFGFTRKRRTKQARAKTFDQLQARKARAKLGRRHGDHMRMGVIVTAGNKRLAFGQAPSGQPSGTPVGEFKIGLYDTRALRARVHNKGEGRMPKRHWFGSNAHDLRYMSELIGKRTIARVAK